MALGHSSNHDSHRALRIAQRLRRFGPRVLFHTTDNLDRVLREDEISGPQAVRLTSCAVRAIVLASKDPGASAGIVVIDRDRLQQAESRRLGGLRPTVLPTDFGTSSIYPLSFYAVGLFCLNPECEVASDERFGWQFMVQMEAMQRHYDERQVRREDIEPLLHLSKRMANHFRSRYDQDTFVKRSFDALLANWLSAREALDRLEA
jgi:hypothetical protein